MKYSKWLIAILLAVLCLLPNASNTIAKEAGIEVALHNERMTKIEDKALPNQLPRFTYDSGYTFNYPEAVRGIYVTGHSAGGARFEQLVKLVDTTDLNAMVIDIKDDWGNLTYQPEKSSKYSHIGQPFISDPEAMMKTLEEKEIYPIGRIVVFKDSVLPKTKPELSFMDGKNVWVNNRKEAFVNPFLKEVWDYNIDIAIETAKLGFKEIQFDYVRFPEGFENRDETLKYSFGEYENAKGDNVQKRVDAITDFTAYAREKLKPYGVDVSVDIFGYTATLEEAPGIGQNFTKIADNVDVISSMIYPSHWTSYFDIPKPDLKPYELVAAYAKLENKKLETLDNPPISRPWLQDFTASWLGSGNYKHYGKAEIEAQIRGLQDEGINEYLLWNAGNTYTKNVDYTP